MKWKEIPGYEGLYQVSDTGLIKSMDRITTGKRKRNIKGMLLKLTFTSTGYYKCELCKEGKKKSCKVHRLVAIAFLPNPHKLPCVNHKDLNPLNNNVENLEWCTQRYNIQHANINGHKTGISRKLSPEQECEIIKRYRPYSKDSNQRILAAQFGVSESVIHHTIKRRNFL